jgi:hypothetical protein
MRQRCALPTECPQFKQFIAKAGTGGYDEAAVQSEISSYIANNKVMVFSWTK